MNLSLYDGVYGHPRKVYTDPYGLGHYGQHVYVICRTSDGTTSQFLPQTLLILSGLTVSIPSSLWIKSVVEEGLTQGIQARHYDRNRLADCPLGFVEQRILDVVVEYAPTL